MREKSRLEMQVKEMQDEVERLRRPQQNSMYSHYASSTFGLNSNSNSNQNDSSYFSPIQHSTQPSSVMVRGVISCPYRLSILTPLSRT